MAGGTTLVGMACPGCGDNLIPHKDMPGFWYSPSCGRSYMRDTSGNLFQIEISGKVETYLGDTEHERHADNAIQFLKLKEHNHAQKEFDYLIKNFPDDYRGWLGPYMIPLDKYLSTGSFSEPTHKYLENALRLNRDSTLHQLDLFFEKLGEHLRFADDPRDTINLAFNDVQIPTIDKFTKWLLFECLSSFLKIEHQPLTKRLYQLSSEYYDQCTEGKLLPVYYDRLPENLKKPAPITYENVPEGSFVLINLLRSFGCTVKVNSNSNTIIVRTPFETKNTIQLSYSRKNHSFSLFGKWLYLIDKGMFILLPRALTQSDVWRFGGHCPYCGSAFKGLFTKTCPNPKCSRYGQPKDY